MKFSYKDVDIVKAVGNSEVPTLVYEARYDKTCPYYMADEVFEGIKHRKKEKIMFDNSEHILGFYRERDKYIKKLLEFVSKYRKDEGQ
jgi:esterase/lipase